jgi:hypothetical protein
MLFNGMYETYRGRKRQEMQAVEDETSLFIITLCHFWFFYMILSSTNQANPDT